MARFAKGQSGNPGGRPKDDIKELARQHGPACIAELAKIAFKAKSTRDRTTAISILLDRGYGKSAPSPEEREDTKSLIVELVKYRNG